VAGHDVDLIGVSQYVHDHVVHFYHLHASRRCQRGTASSGRCSPHGVGKTLQNKLGRNGGERSTVDYDRLPHIEGFGVDSTAEKLGLTVVGATPGHGELARVEVTAARAVVCPVDHVARQQHGPRYGGAYRTISSARMPAA
jgi:hypothetical protein